MAAEVWGAKGCAGADGDHDDFSYVVMGCCRREFVSSGGEGAYWTTLHYGGRA